MSPANELSAAAAAPPAPPATTLREFGSTLLTFVICRGSLLTFDLLVANFTPVANGCQYREPVFGPGREWLDVFFRWDANWYLQIADSGYRFIPDQRTNVSFFPLYPYLARYLGFVVGSPALGGLLISNLGTVIALFYLRRLGQLLFDERVGKLAGVLILVFPTALFLSVFYTEGLFLALTVACMFYYFRGRFVLAAVLGFLAMLTRSTAVALFGALVLDLGLRLLRREQRFRVPMLALGIIPLGLFAYMAVLQHEVHDALALVKSLRSWQRAPAWPWQPLVAAFSGDAGNSWFSKQHLFVEAVFGSSFLALGAVMATKRWPVALWSYVVLGVLMPLSTNNLAGLMRYVLVLFPAFLFMAWLCRDRRDLRWIVIVTSVCFLCIYSLRYMECFWSG